MQKTTIKAIICFQVETIKTNLFCYVGLPDGFKLVILKIALGLLLEICPSKIHVWPAGLGHEKYTETYK